MASKNLFAPPTKEELKKVQNEMFAPPTKAELEPPSFGKNVAKGLIDVLPAAGAVIGGGAGFLAPVPGGTIIGAGTGGLLGESARGALNTRFFPEDAPKSLKEALMKDIRTGSEMAAAEGLLQPVVQIISKIPGKEIAQKVSDKLGEVAGKLAENATGATGKQASEFKQGAGKELLKRKLVRFGDSPKKVSERTSRAMEEANKVIDGAMKSLEKKGVTASADNVVAELQKKAADLGKDPSQAGIVKKINGIIEDIIQTGESRPPIGLAETTKRGFNKMAGNWMDQEVGQAGKQAYRAYRNEVERAATAADPATAKSFKEAKETYGLLAPIQEAAERRASSVKQSPLGGFGDVTAAGAGAMVSGTPGATASVLVRRFISPRMASSSAVVTDKLAKMIAAAPELFGRSEQFDKAVVAELSRRFSENQPQGLLVPQAAASEPKNDKKKKGLLK